MVTYYQILNINRNATNKDVRNSFIKTIDHMKNNNVVTSEILKVKKAYKILSEYHSRRNYDDFLREGKNNFSLNISKIIPFHKHLVHKKQEN